MKRIEISPSNYRVSGPLAQRVDQEINTLTEMDDDNSFKYGISSDNSIVYIALKRSDKNLSRLKQTEIFRVLDFSWMNTAPAKRLFKDPNSEISYAILPSSMFLASETSNYNAVMKRIQIPEDDHSLALWVDYEIETISNDDKSVQCGRSGDDTVVYIALEMSKKNLLEQKLFSVLDNAWRNTASAESRLFEDSNTEISYATLPIFPASKTFKHNAVMKRIKIPKKDRSAFAEQVDQEIEAVRKIDDNNSVQIGKSPDNEIVYIALERGNRNFITPRTKGSEMTRGWLRYQAQEKFKQKYPMLAL